MFKTLTLSKLLSLFILLGILVLSGGMGVYFDEFLKKDYLHNTQKRMDHTFLRLHSFVTTLSDELAQEISIMENDLYLISSIKLINNYQDKNNYNTILLDEEKKLISSQLLDRVKLTANDDIAVYDTNEELISFVVKTPKGYKLNFISYKDGNKTLFSRYENEQKYVTEDFKDYKLIPFKHKNYYDSIDVAKIAIVTHHKHDDAFFIKSHRTFFKQDSQQILAHLEMTHKIDKNSLEQLSENLDMQIEFSNDDKKYQNISIDLLKENSYIDISVHQNESDYYSSAHILAQNGTIYLVAFLNKSPLLQALEESRNKFLLIIIIVTISVFFILQLIFEKRLYAPLSILIEQIKKIENKNYSLSMPVKTHDELEMISKNINQLAQTISKRESELKESQKELEYLSLHDHLTTLPNRRYFMLKLENAIEKAKNEKTHIAVMFLDLDQFKQINDTLGHDIGDKLLKTVSERLSDTLNDSNTLARIGGDEFLILFEDIKNLRNIEVTAQKLLADFKVPFECNKHEIISSASIGITIYPNDGKDSITLIKNADLAMYKSKNDGRNGYCFFSKDLSIQLEERTAYVNALKSATSTFDEFYLMYQPKISLKTGKVEGIEALVRWQSPTLGFVPPDQFISIAEETNMILPLGEWIAQKACSDFVALQKEGITIEHISVNVSTIQLIHSDLIKMIKSLIKSTNINPKQLEIEITESYVATDESTAIKTLQKLRDMDINLAIDDFGTGYSSLKYLKDLPVNRLKIDKSFVDDLPDSHESAAVCKAIISLAKTFNLSITAEGVENEAQLKFLRELQCDEIQGYYFSKPLKIDELKEFYKNNNPNDNV